MIHVHTYGFLLLLFFIPVHLITTVVIHTNTTYIVPVVRLCPLLYHSKMLMCRSIFILQHIIESKYNYTSYICFDWLTLTLVFFIMFTIYAIPTYFICNVISILLVYTCVCFNVGFQHWLGYITAVSPLSSVPRFTSTSLFSLYSVCYWLIPHTS